MPGLLLCVFIGAGAVTSRALLLHMAARQKECAGLYTMTGGRCRFWAMVVSVFVGRGSRCIAEGSATCACVLITGLLLMLQVQVSRHSGARRRRNHSWLGASQMVSPAPVRWHCPEPGHGDPSR